MPTVKPSRWMPHGEGKIKGERWLTCPSYPQYQASSLGRVRRDPLQPLRTKPRILKAHIKSSGYYYVAIVHADGRRSDTAVHTLVCDAFHGPRPSARHEVAHRDGSRTNNLPGNIRWATHKENHEDRKLICTCLRKLPLIECSRAPDARDQLAAILCRQLGVEWARLDGLGRDKFRRCIDRLVAQRGLVSALLLVDSGVDNCATPDSRTCAERRSGS